MAIEDRDSRRKKRKERDPDGDDTKTAFLDTVNLEMISDEEEDGLEGNENSLVDDEEPEEFPDIDARSDSEDDSEVEEDEKDESQSEEDSGNETGSDTSIQIFPKSRTIVSTITGQPRRVYPEIEPDYDSDSSTEDVRTFLHSCSCAHCVVSA